VIPTLRRVVSLHQCLIAMDRQTRLPEEVVVVCQTQDKEAMDYLNQWQAIRKHYRKTVVTVTQPGLIHALMNAWRATSGDVVALTDDDAVPHNDWLERLAAHYHSPVVGGVGGRDIVFDGSTYRATAAQVGTFSWYGRLYGNHHVGTGGAREVDVLKGVNMSFRRELLQFPAYLKGQGAQVHNEIALCLPIRRKGFKLIYDPAALVNHHPAPRGAGDRRVRPSWTQIRFAAFNQTLAELLWLSWPKRWVRLTYQILIGDRDAAGIVRAIVSLPMLDYDAVKSYLPTQAGICQALLHSAVFAEGRQGRFVESQPDRKGDRTDDIRDFRGAAGK